MRISIITVVYNNERTIKSAIDSVLSQANIDLEYIIVDGASKDNTMEVVRSYGKQIHKVVSEPDKGIYDAMNKGIGMATGDIIGILNSDDVYENGNTLRSVVELFELGNCDCVYGNLVYVKETDLNKVVRYWKPGRQKSFLTGWHTPHPTFFVKKSVYHFYGLYNIDLTIAADFEMMLRLIEREKCKTCYLPEIIVRMRLGGESNKSLSNIKKGYSDIKRAFRLNGIKMPVHYPLLRYVPKIKEFLK